MTKEELLQTADLFLFDLDGTVYLGDTPIAGVPAALQTLRDMGKRVVFLTNNSSEGMQRDAYETPAAAARAR